MVGQLVADVARELLRVLPFRHRTGDELVQEHLIDNLLSAQFHRVIFVLAFKHLVDILHCIWRQIVLKGVEGHDLCELGLKSLTQ